jgi:hypothetical protein
MAKAKAKAKTTGKNGGRRPGAGRKPKAANLARRDFNAAVDAMAGPWVEDCLKNLKRLADGIKVYRAKKDGEQVADPAELKDADDAEFFVTPPDFRANQYLLDRLCGRPIERVINSGDDSAPLTVIIKRPDREPDAGD